jgi:hypothetical protein
MKLGADSSDEFELTLADGSDEVDLGASPRDATGSKGKSGVNLKNPADSGISLEKKKPQPPAVDDSDSEFELNLDSSTSGKVSGPKSSGKQRPDKVDSDSEFELTLDDSSSEIAPLAEQKEKDIFETDFDIPALDDESASEAVVLEETDTDLESSDFDLALDESGVIEDDSASEVVELDDDAQPRKSGRRRATDDVEEVSAEEALADVDEEEERRPVVVPAGPQAKPKWGALPALVLAPCLLVMFFVTLMGFEMMRSMWGYRQPASKPASAVTIGLAKMFVNESELPKE